MKGSRSGTACRNSVTRRTDPSRHFSAGSAKRLNSGLKLHSNSSVYASHEMCDSCHSQK